MSELFSGKNREGNLTVLRACKNGISSRDIMRLKTKGDVFNYILELKTKGLIAFADGMYYATEQGKAILEANTTK